MKRTIPLLFLAASLAAPAVARAHDREDNDFDFEPGYDFYTMQAFGQPRLGLHLQSLTPELREYFGSRDDAGMLVARVTDDSPAAQAGIKVGDVLVAIGDVRIRNTPDAFRALRGKWEEQIEITVLRNGREKHFDVTLPKQASGPLIVNPKDLGRFKLELPDGEQLKVFRGFDPERMEKLEDRLDRIEKRLDELESH